MDQEAMDIDYELIIEEIHPKDLENIEIYRSLTSHSMELVMDQMLVDLNLPQAKCPQKRRKNCAAKKRGRKPIRPLDPIKKKTEEKDKYWLRSFRKYIKDNFTKFSSTLNSDDLQFWTDYLSTMGVPEKNNSFSSYGKKYKNYLFSNSDFVCRFQNWFLENAENEISKKYDRGSDLWFVFFDYGSKELLNYIPRGCSSQGSYAGDGSPRSFSMNDVVYSGSGDVGEFCMVNADDQEIESFFS